MGQLADLARASGQGLAGILLAQRGSLLHWVPVCLAVGIGLYFSQRVEPGTAVYIGVGLVALAGIALARMLGEAAAPLSLGCTPSDHRWLGKYGWHMMAPELGQKRYSCVHS